MTKSTRLCLVTPVYNDWPSLLQLLTDVETSFANAAVEIDVLIINDGSTAHFEPDFRHLPTTVVRSITVLDLRANVGSQFAIATGLRYAADNFDVDAVLVMDADGEDRVEDAKRLLEAWRAQPGTIVVGQRAKRSESVTFKISYFLYRVLFRILTGQSISFGNFSLIPRSLLNGVSSRPELAHHYSAAILRSRLPLTYVATARGTRYAGQSQMNMPALVFHAVAAFSVFSDILFSRLLIASACTATVCGIGILIVSSLRFFTELAFPNWATTVVAFFVLLASQAILLILCSGALLLTGRSLMLLTALDATRIHLQLRTLRSRDEESPTSHHRRMFEAESYN